MPKDKDPITAGNASDASGNLITAIGGSAIAVGNTTVATGSVENSAHGNGHVSHAKGEAVFVAAAESTGSTAPSAGAMTFLNVSGADKIIVHEKSGSANETSDVTAASVLKYHAIDHPGSSPNGPEVHYVQHSFHDHGNSSGAEVATGNYAQVSAAAEAHGSQPVAAASSVAITVENQFSFVQAAALVAV